MKYEDSSKILRNSLSLLGDGALMAMDGVWLPIIKRAVKGVGSNKSKTEVIVHNVFF